LAKEESENRRNRAFHAGPKSSNCRRHRTPPIAAVIAETGAASIKDMGKVMPR